VRGKNMKINSMLLTDFYKTIHHLAYVERLETLVSYWTPRMSREEKVDKVVMFGLQAAVKKYLIEEFNENFFNRPKEEVVKEYKRIILNSMTEQAADTEFLEKLYDLGYLPIQIKAVAEGERVNIKTPMFEIRNTVKGFGWLVNYLETLLSCNVWMPMTSATKAFMFREIVEEYFDKTVEEGKALKSSAVGDFSMRGMGAVDAAMASGAAHLTSFTGTATIPAIVWLEEYYGADCSKEVVGRGTPSTEHSVMSSYGKDGEFDCYKRLINKVFPKGNLSIVSDTYDYWNVLTNYLPKLKEDILARDDKIIIRGDSGNPVDIICGEVQAEDLTNNKYIKSVDDCAEWVSDILVNNVKCNTPHGECGEAEVTGYFKYKGKTYEVVTEIFWNRYDKQYYYIDESKIVSCREVNLKREQRGTVELLWDIFGGHINKKDYKVLDSHIGTIYGDSITPERAREIYDRLEKKGFAASCVTLGAGSYSYQFSTRDVYSFALKTTNSVINGVERQIFKEPKTDTGNFKKSQRGMCYVYRDGNNMLYKDGLTIKEVDSIKDNLLEMVFYNGKMIKEYSLKDIRNRLHNNKF